MWLFSPSTSLSPEFIHTSEVINILDFNPSILNTISFSSSSFCWISHFSSLSFLCSFFLPINLEALLCFKVLFMATYSSESFKYIYFFKCIYSIKRKYIYSIKRKESFYIIFILYTLKKKTHKHEPRLSNCSPLPGPKQEGSFSSRLLISFPFKNDSSVSRIPT